MSARRVVMALVAIACTAATGNAAVSDVPPGFVANAALSKAETFVAGKPVATYCAPTEAAIAATVDPTLNVEGEAIQGSTVIGSATSYFSPTVCNFTRLWLNGRLVTRKPVNLLTVAMAVLTVAHEGELAKGVSDETDADCAALKALPQLVAKFFPLKKRETLHDFMADAWEVHGLSPAIYREHAC
jgi:hypothetical protein